MNAIDALDQRILDVLLTDSRISLKQLAEQVGLSSPACRSACAGWKSAA
ncbi:AsnC family transcriptional regulator [Stenotrophomonas maltophilia]